jgi:uncharacterized protein YgiM (DUF1202 family)
MKFIPPTTRLHKLCAGLISVAAIALTAIPAQARPATTITGANLRSAATLNARVVNSFPTNTRLEVLNIARSPESGLPWYYVRSRSGQEGWMAGELLSFSADQRRYGTLAGDLGDRINIRAGASLNSAVRHTGIVGDLVQIEDSRQEPGGYQWYRVRFPNQSTGWVRQDVISVWTEGC